jgi:hypothetical protein
MSLASVVVAGLVVAFWPEDRAPAPYRPAGAQVTPDNQPFEGGLRLPPEAHEAHEARGRRIWL